MNFFLLQQDILSLILRECGSFNNKSFGCYVRFYETIINSLSFALKYFKQAQPILENTIGEFHPHTKQLYQYCYSIQANLRNNEEVLKYKEKWKAKELTRNPIYFNNLYKELYCLAELFHE